MKRNYLFSLLALVALWLGWIIAYVAVGNEYVLPSFWETLKECGKLFISAAFWRAFWGTFARTLIAFAVSFLCGVSLALCAVLVKPLRAFFAPVVSVLRSVPTMAVILLLLIWTSPKTAPVIVAVLVLFPAVYAAALTSFQDIRERFGIVADNYKVPFKKKLFQMYLPLATPSVLFQSGAILSMGLKITISAEVLANTYKSMGGLMQEAKMFLETPRLMALTLTAVVHGFLLEALFSLCSKFIVRWKA